MNDFLYGWFNKSIAQSRQELHFDNVNWYPLMNFSILLLQGTEINQSQTVGLLDFFGFENWNKNRFETLAINYCNEKIQQVQTNAL